MAPTQPFRAALGAESRVCYLGKKHLTFDKRSS
jgi:hypothetical protein